jgi:hypothetical protein
MSTDPNTLIKMMATGLGVGVLLDATVIRALLVPATVALFGRWNWKVPAVAARLLRVPPSRSAIDVAPRLDRPAAADPSATPGQAPSPAIAGPGAHCPLLLGLPCPGVLFLTVCYGWVTIEAGVLMRP